MAQRYKSAQATTQLPAAHRMRVAITGGTSGLGLALVREFKARGCVVAFVARDAARVAEIAKQTGAHGIVGDVARKDDIYPIAMQIAGELGGLDVLVNNASSLGPMPLALLGDTECEDLERALATNLLGPFRLTKALLGALAASAREGRGAVVLNVSSDAAINAYPALGRIRREQGGAAPPEPRSGTRSSRRQDVRFLSLDPGDMDTPLHALARARCRSGDAEAARDAARELVDAIVAACRVCIHRRCIRARQSTSRR